MPVICRPPPTRSACKWRASRPHHPSKRIRFAHREASLPGLSGLWDPPASVVLEQLGEREPPTNQEGRPV